MSDPFGLAALPDPLPVTPAPGPLDAEVTLPGSKSITNRALLAAALAEGTSTLRGALDADDTRAMVDAVRALGATVEVGDADDGWVVTGVGGAPADGDRAIDARLSGTTSRFLLPALALGSGPSRLDGAPPLRGRPMADGIAAARALGAEVDEVGQVGHLPVVVQGGSGRLAAGTVAVAVPGDASSQFLSGLLLTGPCLPGGLDLAITGRLVSRPYVDMTLAVMAAFGASARWVADDRLAVAPGGYRATGYAIEPDASAASYAFAAAAVCGGRVRVRGLGVGSLQGDAGFVDVLARMGATVHRSADATEVVVDGPLHGVTEAMGDLSDTAQTLAAVAPYAEGPTEVTGIGFIRHKETDRIGDVVAELGHVGVRAEERPDGFVVHPGPVSPGVVQTHDDHRMAMAFAVLGLGAAGVRIGDPACVAKTFPGFWSWLEDLRASAAAR